jgi:glycogen phosphorylase
MKASMKKLAPQFSTIRMVQDYASKFYVPAARREDRISQEAFRIAKELVEWKDRLRENWGEVKVLSVEAEADKLATGERGSVRATVQLGAAIQPADVSVQLYAGPVDADRNLTDTEAIPLTLDGPVKEGGEGAYLFVGSLPSHQSGQHGYTVRVLPAHKDAVLPQELPLIAWE